MEQLSICSILGGATESSSSLAGFKMILKQLVRYVGAVLTDVSSSTDDLSWTPCESLFYYYQIVDNYYFQLIDLRHKVRLM